jgi:carboxypeptidase PM20D1
MDRASLPSLRTVAAVVGGAAAAAAAAALVRAVRAGSSTARQPPTVPDAEVAELAAHFAARAGDLADTLAAAIRLRTVSYEDAAGNACSLLSAAEGAPGASARPAKASRCSGCACSNHAMGEAMGTDGGGAAAAGGSSPSSPTPTPAALARSRADTLAFHRLLERAFPTLHSHPDVTRTVVNELSLVYVWAVGKSARGTGVDAAATAPAAAGGRGGVCLCAHLDVVPVPDEPTWTHPPFDGVIAPDESGEPHVWGRGAIDDKHAVVAICAAVDALLAGGKVPPVPYIVLAFGHDEELGGPDGAAAIARALPSLVAAAIAPAAAAAGGSLPPPPAPPPLPSPLFSWLLDEGLFLIRGFFPGHEPPVAVVCVGEKGHVNVELRAEAPAGHSSVPPLAVPTTTIGRIGRAVARVEAAPFSAHASPADGLLAALLPGMRLFPHRLLFANLWLTWPVARAALLSSPAAAALIRTTTAVTLVSGGVKSNVLPPAATAVVNHRIHPAESVASVLAHDAAAVGDPAVAVTALEPLEPSPRARTDGPGWTAIGDAVRGVFGAGVAVAPGLMLGNTDTRHYWALAADIYRHVPTELDVAGTARFHGRDERVAVANLGRLAAFYAVALLGAAPRGA